MFFITVNKTILYYNSFEVTLEKKKLDRVLCIIYSYTQTLSGLKQLLIKNHQNLNLWSKNVKLQCRFKSCDLFYLPLHKTNDHSVNSDICYYPGFLVEV